MRIVDLRSDTLTKPTPAMRRAMAEAEVGDDVFGEDPTVRALEEKAAERLGKEAALFVASGSMANLVSLLTHCGRGDEVILGEFAHIFVYEQGGISALGSIVPRTLRNGEDGTLDPAEIEGAIRPDNIHFPITRLIALENSHNRCTGSPLSPTYMKQVGEIARRHGIKLHVDGARIFNAAVSQGVSAGELASEADSVSFCLSKGLAAPVGSLVCGPSEFIARARRTRKLLGGGMRQAGVIAAAGIVALDQMVDRLAEDHANARRLAEGIAETTGLAVELPLIRTNIVRATIERSGLSAPELTERLAAEGVLTLPLDASSFRAVTHYHITRDDIDFALSAFRRVMGV